MSLLVHVAMRRWRVHHFKVWNTHKGDWEIPPSKRMADSIHKLDGQVIPGTESLIKMGGIFRQALRFKWRNPSTKAR